MSPYFLSGDMTFGVNQLKRNVDIMNGIDCNNQIFSALHCFMPSKKGKAYKWVFSEAMPYLFSKDVCSRIQCITTDQEEAEVKPLHALKSVDCFKNITHRLDMYHILLKPWTEVVVVKADKDNPMCEELLERLLNILRLFFTYVENIREFNHVMQHFKIIYREHKNVIKAPIACEKIEDIMATIDNNK